MRPDPGGADAAPLWGRVSLEQRVQTFKQEQGVFQDERHRADSQGETLSEEAEECRGSDHTG